MPLLRSTSRLLATLAGASLALTATAQTAKSWKGPTPTDGDYAWGNLSTGANWVGGTAPTSSLTSFYARFDQNYYNNYAVVDSSRQIAGLEFAAGIGEGAVSWSGTGSPVLTLGAYGLRNLSNAFISIDAPLALGANSLFRANDGSFNISSTLNLSTRTLTLEGSSIYSSNLSGVISGTGAIVVNTTGSGRWSLTGANTYTGGTTLTAGKLMPGNATALGTGSLIFNGGTLATYYSSLTMANAVTVAGTANIETSSSGTTTLSGPVTMTGSRTFNVTGEGKIVLGGALGQSAAGYALSKTGTGALVLNSNSSYTGTTTITGGTLALGTSGTIANANLTLNGGVLATSGTFSRTLGSGAGQFQFGASGGGFAAYGGPLTIPSFMPNAYWGLSGFINGQFLYLGSTVADNVVTFTNDFSLGSAFDSDKFIVVDDNPTSTADKAVLSGVISGASNLAKTGAGRLELTGANSFSGTTYLLAGTLRAAHATALGTSRITLQSSTLELAGDSATAFGNMLSVMSAGGTLVSDRLSAGEGVTHTLGTLSLSGTLGIQKGSNVTSGTAVLAFGSTNGAGTFNVQSGARLELASFSGSSILTFTGAGDAVVLGSFTTGAATLTKSGTGSLTLHATSSRTGATTLSGGTLWLGADNALGTGALTLSGASTLGALNGSRTAANALTLSGPATLGGAADLTLTGAVTNTADTTLTVTSTGLTTLSGALALSNSAANRTLTLNNTGALVLSGAIGNGSTSTAGALLKNGAGELTLSGLNTFAGPTTINAGTLRLTGSLATSSLLTIADGATLTGGGAASHLALAGTYAPGSSPALVSLDSLTMQNTASLQMELGGTSRGTDYDALDITGTLTAAGTLEIVFINGFSPTGPVTFNVFDFASFSGEFATITLPALPAELGWDTADLTTTGELHIKNLKQPATVTLSDLNRTYDGSPKPVTATTAPAGLTVVVTYDGSATAPTAAGSYAVVATIDDTGHTGSATGTLVIEKALQTITFSAPANRTYGDADFAVGATATSGLPPTISVVGGPATIDGGTITLTGVGTVTLRATQEGDANYLGATPVDQTFTVAKATATVTLSDLTATYDGSAKGVTATTSPAGLTVNLTYDGSATPPTNAGSYAVVATIDDANYEGTTSDTLVIAKATATVTLSDLTATYDGSAKGATATTSPAGLTVHLTYDGSATPPTSAGSYAVVATIDDTNYAGSASDTLVIGKALQTIAFNPVPGVTYGDVPFTVSATATSGLPVTFSIVSGPATLDEDLVTITGAGAVIVRAAQAGDVNHEAATPVDQEFTVGKANQAIAFTAPDGVTYGDVPFAISATASSSLPVTFTIVSGPATIDGDTLTITGAGAVVVRASQAGDANYNPAPDVDQSFTAGKANQAITFAAPSDRTYGEASFTVEASASSGLPVTFSIAHGPASVSGNAVTLLGAGTVILRASQAGDDNYNPAPHVEHTFAVAKKTLTVTAQDASRSYGTANPAFALSYAGFVAGDDSSALDAEPVATTTATADSDAGTYAISVSGGSSADYAFDYQSGTLTITRAAQSLTFESLADKTFGDAAFTVTASASSGLAPAFSVVSGPASLSGDTVTLTGAGTVTIRASQEGNLNYAAATAIDQSFAVGKASATLTLANLSATYDGSAKSVSVTTAPANLAVTLTYDGNSVAPSSAGSYAVAATIDDANYTGSASGTLVIAKGAQTITLATDDTPRVGASVTLDATASSGLDVALEVLSGDATLAGTSLTITSAASDIVVRATQAGNANYAAADVTLTIAQAAIERLSQAIAFVAPPDQVTTAGPLTLEATASSNLEVSFTLVSGPASLSGRTLTLTGAPGIVVVTASQPGNAFYQPAPQVTRSVTIAPAGPQVFFGDTTSGDAFAAHLTADNTSGVIIGHLAGSGEGFLFTFTPAGDGTFSGTATTFAGAMAGEAASLSIQAMVTAGGALSVPAKQRTATAATSSAAAATNGTLTITGTVANGVLTGMLEELGLTFTLELQSQGGPAADLAGFYTAAATETASGSLYAIVDAQGSLYVLAATGDAVLAGTAELAADLTFALTMSSEISLTGAFATEEQTLAGTITVAGETISYAGTSSTTPRTDRLLNLSARAAVGADHEQTLIAGFVVGGSEPKTVLLRAVGPSLAPLGVSRPLAAPRLILFDGAGTVLREVTGWEGDATLAETFAAVGAFDFAAGSADSALVATLAPGIYTMHVTGNGATGVALTEVYDVSAQSAYQRLVNISSRGHVAGGENVLIGGFVVGGNAPKRVLIRGVGPGLAAHGVAAPLANPTLALYSGGTVIARNDDWETPVVVSAGQTAATANDLGAAAESTGAFALAAGSKDAALIVTLAPGPYTVHVAGASGDAPGIALVEVYEVP